MSALFLCAHWLQQILIPLRIRITFHKIKHSINKTYRQQYKQSKFETRNYTQSKEPRAWAHENDCCKVKLLGLVGPLNYNSLGMDLLDPSN